MSSQAGWRLPVWFRGWSLAAARLCYTEKHSIFFVTRHNRGSDTSGLTCQETPGDIEDPWILMIRFLAEPQKPHVKHHWVTVILTWPAHLKAHENQWWKKRKIKSWRGYFCQEALVSSHVPPFLSSFTFPPPMFCSSIMKCDVLIHTDTHIFLYFCLFHASPSLPPLTISHHPPLL